MSQEVHGERGLRAVPAVGDVHLPGQPHPVLHAERELPRRREGARSQVPLHPCPGEGVLHQEELRVRQEEAAAAAAAAGREGEGGHGISEDDHGDEDDDGGGHHGGHVEAVGAGGEGRR